MGTVTINLLSSSLVKDKKIKQPFDSSSKGTPQTCGMRSGRVYLTQGQSCGEHSTGAHEEMLVFLSGSGRSLVGPEKEALEVGVGKVIYIPPHTLHNIENPNSNPLVYIYCVAPITEDSEGKNE